MQRSYSTKENEIRWNDDFNSKRNYSHGKYNSYGVLIVILVVKTYTFRNKASDKHGRILIPKALIDNTEFILINLHNANAENDQLTTFAELTNLLEIFNLARNNR